MVFCDFGGFRELSVDTSDISKTFSNALVQWNTCPMCHGQPVLANAPTNLAMVTAPAKPPVKP